MNTKLSQLQELTNKTIKDKERKENGKKFKKTAKKVAWTILMISAGACWTITYYQWQDFRADYLTAVSVSTRIIERNHSAVTNSEEKSDDDGDSDSVQSASVQEVTSETPVQGRTTEQIIEDTAKQHGYKNIELLKKIAFCESSYKADATNPYSTATGTYQFTESTWNEACKATGHTDWTLEDRKDPEKATRVAIWYIAKGQIGRWSESQHCWNS